MTPLGQGMLLALNLIEQERINLRDNGISYTPMGYGDDRWPTNG